MVGLDGPAIPALICLVPPMSSLVHRKRARVFHVAPSLPPPPRQGNSSISIHILVSVFYRHGRLDNTTDRIEKEIPGSLDLGLILVTA